MTDTDKVKSAHTRRAAFVYIRQSSPSQVERNKESTARQYSLVARARQLGWPDDQITVIDEDLGLSGANAANRSGFTRLTSAVAMGQVGLVLGLEVSRLARNNADWYRLIELCAVTDTLLGDNDGLYHPAVFNDRLILGVKGTMSEMELHLIRARLEGGRRNKAVRGEFQSGLPVGLVWGERDGEVLLDPDEAVTTAIRAVFARFAEFGSARRVWLWFRSEGLPFPLRQWPSHPVKWVAPSYHAIHQVLTHPAYAGAYVYGRTCQETFIDQTGVVKKRTRRLPQEQWGILLINHHMGYLDWATFESNQARLDSNTHPEPHQAGGAVREGSALLQGIGVCGNCGRKLRTHYTGSNSNPGYHCAGKTLTESRGLYCLRVGGAAVDEAVADAFLRAVTPAAVEAVLLAIGQLQAGHDAALAQWRLEVERLRYEAEKAERRYRSVEPENRLVARGLEAAWEARLRDLAEAEAELSRKQQQQSRTFGDEQLKQIRTLGSDLRLVWNAPATTDHDRKQLLRALLEEVIVNVNREQRQAVLTLRWRGSTLTTVNLGLPRFKPSNRTDEDTIELLGRLAALYPDGVIAGILNQQGRTTASGDRFTANHVASLRHHRKIPGFKPPEEPPAGDLVNIRQAAELFGIDPSTFHRWISEGFIAGKQMTPGAPWQIRLTDELRAKFTDETPAGFLPMLETMLRLGVTRQTVMQRVKRGELEAVLVTKGRRKGLRIRAMDNEPTLFGQQN
jgi:DNA invertase Pin-like site-specific DNA recombinase